MPAKLGFEQLSQNKSEIWAVLAFFILAVARVVKRKRKRMLSCL